MSIEPIRIAATDYDTMIAHAVNKLIFILLIATSLVSFSFGQEISSLRRFLGYPLFIFANVMLVWLGFHAKRLYNFRAPRALQILLFLQLAWGAVVIFRALDIDPSRIRDLFGTHWGAIPFLLPILVWCGLSPTFWLVLFKYGVHLLMFGVFYLGVQVALRMAGGEPAIFLISQHVIFLAPLFFFSGFIMIKRYLYLGFAGIIFWTLLSFFNDSRETIALNSWYFICAFVMMRQSTIITLKKSFYIALISGTLLAFLAFEGLDEVYQTIATSSLDERVTAFFIEGGAFKDSRQGIYEPFFRDLSFWEKIWGRGAVASYDPGDSHLAQYHLGGRLRRHIEVGHLYHMLTGGIIQNILFSSLALGGVFLGLRRSRNRFTYGLAFIVLGWVLLMLTAAFPSGNLRYVLVWLAIGGCWSKELRSMTTQEFIQLWTLSQTQTRGRRFVLRRL